jgi:hypothetical protein
MKLAADIVERHTIDELGNRVPWPEYRVTMARMTTPQMCCQTTPGR